METVELKGLKYGPDLQDESSAFSIVLTSTLKTKVRADCTEILGPDFMSHVHI